MLRSRRCTAGLSGRGWRLGPSPKNSGCRPFPVGLLVHCAMPLPLSPKPPRLGMKRWAVRPYFLAKFARHRNVIL